MVIKMKSMNWYISFDFAPSDTERIVSLCKMLKDKGDMLLCGINFMGNCPITKENEKEIDSLFEIYQSNSECIDEKTQAAIGRLIADELNIREENVRYAVTEGFESLDEEKRWRIKLITSVLQREAADIMRNKVFDPQNIVFSAMPDIRFSSEYEISTQYDKKDLFFWYRINPEDIKKLGVVSPNVTFMISDGGNFGRYRYLIEIVEYNEYSLALCGEKQSIEQRMKNNFSGLFGEDKQFTAFRPELKKYM